MLVTLTLQKDDFKHGTIYIVVSPFGLLRPMVGRVEREKKNWGPVGGSWGGGGYYRVQLSGNTAVNILGESKEPAPLVLSVWTCPKTWQLQVERL